MDLRLPDADGTEAARSPPGRSRGRRASPSWRVTALPLDGHDGWVSEAGFAGYIAKPIDIDELPDAVRRFATARPVEASAARSRAVAAGVPASPGTCRQAWLAGGRGPPTVDPYGGFPSCLVRLRAAGGRDTRRTDLMGRKSLRLTKSKLAFAIALVVLASPRTQAASWRRLEPDSSGPRSRRLRSATSSRTCTTRRHSPGTKSSGRMGRPTSTSSRTRGSPVAAPAGTRTRAPALSSSPRGP